MVENLDLKDLGLVFNTEGFGPVSGVQWEEFDGKLYQPYNKREKIGKVCDFVSAAQLNIPVKTTKVNAIVAATEIFAEEEKGFEVIEEATVLKKKVKVTGPQVRKQNPYHQRGGGRGQPWGRGRGGNQPYWHRQDQSGYTHQWGKKGFREPSIEVRGDWPVIAELSKNQLEKLGAIQPGLVSVETSCGEIHQYNKDVDKSRTYKNIPLNVFSGQVFNVQTLEDPVFQRLAKENKADIFATETAVAAIMTAPKSLYSWDVIIKKYQDKIFIDRRDEPNMLDYLTVNETSHDNQPLDDESVNGVRQLMQEAVNVNNSWVYQQYSKDKKFDLKEKDPFIEVEDQVAARMGYFYKIWKLDKERKICIRSSVHSYIPKANETNEEGDDQNNQRANRIYQNCYALVEFENNKSNWKANLDMMMAQCLTKEVQDNSCKVSRWVVQSLLAGVDQIKFAFMTRKTPKDSTKHVILGTYGIDTKSFSNQINLNMPVCWAILRETIDYIYQYKEVTGTGEYIMMKDPNKAVVRIFKVTADEIDEEEPEEEL